MPLMLCNLQKEKEQKRTRTTWGIHTTNQPKKTNHPFYGHYTGQPALAGTPS